MSARISPVTVPWSTLWTTLYCPDHVLLYMSNQNSGRFSKFVIFVVVASLLLTPNSKTLYPPWNPTAWSTLLNILSNRCFIYAFITGYVVVRKNSLYLTGADRHQSNHILNWCKIASMASTKKMCSAVRTCKPGIRPNQRNLGKASLITRMMNKT